MIVRSIKPYNFTNLNIETAYTSAHLQLFKEHDLLSNKVIYNIKYGLDINLRKQHIKLFIFLYSKKITNDIFIICKVFE